MCVLQEYSFQSCRTSADTRNSRKSSCFRPQWPFHHSIPMRTRTLVRDRITVSSQSLEFGVELFSFPQSSKMWSTAEWTSDLYM